MMSAQRASAERARQARSVSDQCEALCVGVCRGYLELLVKSQKSEPSTTPYTPLHTFLFIEVIPAFRFIVSSTESETQPRCVCLGRHHRGGPDSPPASSSWQYFTIVLKYAFLLKFIGWELSLPSETTLSEKGAMETHV
jgi:hypothetical protein